MGGRVLRRLQVSFSLFFLELIWHCFLPSLTMSQKKKKKFLITYGFSCHLFASHITHWKTTWQSVWARLSVQDVSVPLDNTQTASGPLGTGSIYFMTFWIVTVSYKVKNKNQILHLTVRTCRYNSCDVYMKETVALVSNSELLALGVPATYVIAHDYISLINPSALSPTSLLPRW